MYNFRKKIISINLFLMILTVIGFLLRSYQINIPSYWLDEGHTINAIKGIYDYGFPKMISGEVYSKHWLFYYLSYFSTLIFGNNELGYRAVSIIFGTATIPLSFLFSKKIFKDYHIAILTSILVSLNQFQIAWSRQARSYTMLQFFFLLSVYFLYKLIEKFNLKNLTYWLASSLLCFLSHPMGGVIVPVGIIILIISYWQEIKNFDYQILLKKLNFQLIIAGLLLAFILVTPKLIDFIQMGFNKEKNVTISYLKLILDQFLVIFPGAILGLIYLIWQDEKNFFFLTLLFSLPLSAIFWITDIVQLRYIFFMLPLFFLLFSYLIVKITYLFSNNKWYQFLVPLFLLIILTGSNLQFIPKISYSIGSLTPQPNFKQAYRLIEKGSEKNQIIVSPYTVISQAYLENAGYWLKISMTGKKSELKQYQNKTNEFYTNSPIIHNFKELKKIAQRKDGYLVIDKMYLNRRSHLSKFKKNYELILHTGKDLNELWLFKI
jgi:uncharacterized membrane protein